MRVCGFNQILVLPRKHQTIINNSKIAVWTTLAIAPLCLILLIYAAFHLRLKTKLRPSTEEKKQDYMEGTTTIPMDAIVTNNVDDNHAPVANNADDNDATDEMWKHRRALTPQFILRPESYKIG